MGGVIALEKLQLGKETTPGTAVAASVIWRGMGSWQDRREVKNAKERVGIALPSVRPYVPKIMAAYTMDPVEATFQQLPYILESAVESETPTQDGAGTGYIRSYIFPYTSIPTLRTHTLEAGNNQQAREMEYAFVEKFKLTGKAGEAAFMSGGWVGRQWTDTTFTGSLTVPTLIPADHMGLFDSNLYIDAVSGNVGTTEITGTLLAFELDVTTGWVRRWDNSAKTFADHYFSRDAFKATCKFTFEHDTNAEAQRDLFEAGTARLFRIYFGGAALATPATETELNARVDFAGVYTDVNDSSQDGDGIVEATVEIGYDFSEALGLAFRVVNEDADLYA